MNKHDPLYYARSHRKAVQGVSVLYLIGLVSTHFNENTAQMSMLAFQAWLGAWIAIELLSAWYRKWWMEGGFRNWQVILKMAYVADEEVARDIAYNVAVWPAVKTAKHLPQFASDIRVIWLMSIMVSFSFAFTSIMLA